MEIRIDREILFKSVSRVQSIIEKRSNMPILSMILLSADDSTVTLSATDLEISYQQKIPAEVTSSGNITISGRKIFEILKESKSKDIYILEKENNWIFISADKARYNLASLSAEEYPVFVEPEDVSMIDIDGKILKEMIDKTIYSVTMEEAGFKLSGVFTERIAQGGRTYFRMVSTDGHRLSLIDKELTRLEELALGNGVMIPKKGMMEISKLVSDEGQTQIGLKKNNCVIKKDQTVLVIRLLESKFPDYNAVIPKESKYQLKIDKETLLDGMKKMIILSDESYKGVKITLDNNIIELVSINPELGDAQESIDIEFSGERIEIGFNARYFIDVLQAMDSEAVELGFTDNSTPCLITGEEDHGFLGLVMPMRL